MSTDLIRPGKPMDDATFVKYLRQGSVPGKLVIKGKTIITYDFQIIIQTADARFGGFSYILRAGNFFREHTDIAAIIFFIGKNYGEILCQIDPQSDHLRNNATAIEVVQKDDDVKFKVGKSDSKRIIEQFLEVAKANGQMIPKPIKQGASVIVECSLVPVSGQKFYQVKIEKIERNENEANESNYHKKLKYNQRFIQNVKPAKERPDTDIIERIKKATPTKGKIIIDVTPTMAEDIMMLNTKNRHIYLEEVFGHAEQMANELWIDTNQATIGIDINGKLYDGQHKLLAMIKAGKTYNMVIFTGSPVEAFEVVDSGRKRTPGDTLSVENVPNANQAAACVKFIILLLEYGVVTTKRVNVTNHDINKWIKDERNYRKLKECMSWADTVPKKNAPKTMLTLTQWTGMYYAFTSKHKTEGHTFMEKLATGEGISRYDGSQIYFLRKELLNWGNKADRANGRTSSNAKVHWMIEAWNLYRERDGKGRPVEIEKLKVDTSANELPKISR